MRDKPPIRGDIGRLTTADKEPEAMTSARDGIRVIGCFDFQLDHELEVIELAALSGLDWSKLMQALKRLCLLGYLEPTTGQTYRLSPRMFPAGGRGQTPRVYRADRK